MPRVTFVLRRENGVKNSLRRLFKLSPLGDTYYVSVQVDGVPQTIRVGNRALLEVTTGWGKRFNASDLSKFLQTYRTSPEQCQPDEHIRTGLHQFLFAGGILDAPFAAISPHPSEVVIVGGSDTNQLLLNVPWELADGVPVLSPPEEARPLIGTLASVALARAVRGTSAGSMNIQNAFTVDSGWSC